MGGDRIDRFGAYLLAVPLTALTIALGTLALRLGAAGAVSGAVAGTLWSLLLGFVAARLMHRKRWRSWLADAAVAAGIVASGLLIGGGPMYVLLMNAALNEPTTTYATLTALMRTAVPYFIAVNSSMEALIVPLVAFLNWRTVRRRPFIIVAALAYFAMRVWTYLAYAPLRLEITQRSLSAEDVLWFKETLAVDFRAILVAITLLALVVAAFAPASHQSKREARERNDQALAPI